MKNKTYIRGRWAGLSARTIQRLSGCSYYKTLKLLKALPEEITLETIGELIHDQRSKKENKQEQTLDYFLTDPATLIWMRRNQPKETEKGGQ